jgi:hypothetical protein
MEVAQAELTAIAQAKRYCWAVRARSPSGNLWDLALGLLSLRLIVCLCLYLDRWPPTG